MYERSTPMPRTPQRPEPRRYLGRFPGDLAAVKDARDWLSRRLALSRVPDSPAHDALLILSELATNVLLHAPAETRGTAFLVSVFVSGNCLRISVRANGGAPAPILRPVPPTPEAEHGRGLFLVNALATTWGAEHTRQGQAVYFTLGWEQHPEQPGLTHSGRASRPSLRHQRSAVPAPRSAPQHPGGW